MEIKNKNILVICAHLDDETYGMGGTLLKLANPELNNKIRVLTFCHGMGKQDEQRITEYYKNLDDIGIEGTVLNYEDVTLETTTTLELTRVMDEYTEMVLSDIDIVFTHKKEDTHFDHLYISELVDIWARDKKVSIFHFGIGANNEWFDKPLNPICLINISGFEKDKKKLIRRYKKYPKNHPLSYKKIKARDEYLGSIIGVESAEAFEIKRITID